LLTCYTENYFGEDELVLGDVFSNAMKNGFRINAVKGETYLDTGTVEDLSKAIKIMDLVEGQSNGY
jgi:glucose-1-phosphate thymidylyltransferase